MTMNNDAADEDKLYLGVYLTLLGLTALTIACSSFGFAPILGVTAALAVAATKAGLIAFYFMHLRKESALIYGVAVVGVVAVLVLAAGILPDIALRL